jgi:hypothetical protein
VLEVGAELGDEIAASGEADDADAVWVNVPGVGVLADEAHGSLSVLQSGGVFREWTGVGDSVFDEDAVDADGVEPAADLGALDIESEDFVGAAGEGEDGGAGVVSFSGVKGEGGIRDVGEPDVVATGDEVADGGVGFGRGMGGFPGCSVGPEVEGGEVGGGLPDRRLCEESGRDGEQSGESDVADSHG